MEYEIGIGKTARRAYGFDEVAIVPSRRTRDPGEALPVAAGFPEHDQDGRFRKTTDARG